MAEQNNILLHIENFKKTFVSKDPQGNKTHLQAVAGVTFDIFKGETFGLVGESGCGKSTLGRTILGLYKPDFGSKIVFDGRDISNLTSKERKNFTTEAQLIFQDPSACLNPRRTIKQILTEPFIIHKLSDGQKKIDELLDMVGLASYHLDRFPHELSGGQKQRIGIARALAVSPKLIICDEPVSALDVSIQAQVINLLEDLQSQLGLTYLFISHDLGVVHHTSNRVGVMYLGKIVELSSRDELYNNTLHPYTKALISAIPTIEKDENSKRIVLYGDMPSPRNVPSGCRFKTRCQYKMDICENVEPALIDVGESHFVACHLCVAT